MTTYRLDQRFPTGVPRKILEKNYLGTSHFAVFVCKISEFRSEDGFFLEGTNFGKEVSKKEREFS